MGTTKKQIKWLANGGITKWYDSTPMVDALSQSGYTSQPMRAC